jgi:stalled ribosome alternative rescue factor ArfA
MAQPTRESAIKRIVRTPLYRMRVERDKTKFVRKEKHKQSPDRKHDWAFLLCAPIC